MYVLSRLLSGKDLIVRSAVRVFAVVRAEGNRACASGCDAEAR